MTEACLIYRNGYMTKFNVDPFNAVITVGYSSMYIYRNCFTNNIIASNTDERVVSMLARQWLTDIRNNNEGVSLLEEVGLEVKIDFKANI